MPIVPLSASSAAKGALIPIGTTKLSSGSGAITFSNIPQIYQDLYLVTSVRMDYIYTASANGFFIWFNGDSATTSYARLRLATNGSGTDNGIDNSSSGAGNYLGYSAVGLNSPVGTYGLTETFIHNYRSSTFKNYLSKTVSAWPADGLAGGWCQIYLQTLPITSVTVAPPGTFQPGSTFTLYAVRAVGQ